jgi:hypothetical protein
MRVANTRCSHRSGFTVAFPLLLLFLLAGFLSGKQVVQQASAAEQGCDSCRYDGSDADTDCKVYGQLGDDVLIPYHRASQDCLDAHNIKVEAVDATMLTTMFPNADGSDANVNAFISWLKNDSGVAVNAILSSLDFFFVESSTNGQKPVFQDEIVVEGVTYDCSASESDCWNALKSYFESSDEGQEILVSVGEDLYSKAAVGRELEQSTVRIAICNNGALASDGSCDVLAAQIDELKMAHADKSCSAFGLGPAENAIAGCENADGTGGDANGGNSTARETTSNASTTTGSFFIISSVVIAKCTMLFLF